MRRIAALAVGLAMAAALPACGGGGSSTRGSGSGTPAGSSDAASLVPSTALALVSVTLSPSSDQKAKVDAIGAKFGAKQNFDQVKSRAIDTASKQLGLDPQNVRSWLGDHLAVAVLPGSGASSSPAPVGLLEVKDEAKARDDLARVNPKNGQKPSYRVIGHFAVIAGGPKEDAATSKALLDQIDEQSRHQADSLAKQAKFSGVLSHIHGDQLATAWIDGKGLLELAQRRGAKAGRSAQCGASSYGNSDLAFGLHAEDQAVALDGFVQGAGAQQTNGGKPSLSEGVPADALAELTVFDLGSAFDKVVKVAQSCKSTGTAGSGSSTPGSDTVKPGRRLPGIPGGDPTAALKKATGIDLQTDVLPFMHGETAIVVGAPAANSKIPSFGLVVDPTDKAKARSAVDKIRAAIESRLGSLRFEARSVNGGTAYVFPVPLPKVNVQPAFGVINDRFIIASSPEELTALASTASNPLSASPSYKSVLGSAEGPVQFQLLARLGAVRGLIGSLVQRSKNRLGKDLKSGGQALQHLDSLGLRISRSGDAAHFTMKVSFN
ncbi:MAG: DUF3352 domain-containing protein [Acidimicrobiales bacterium]